MIEQSLVLFDPFMKSITTKKEGAQSGVCARYQNKIVQEKKKSMRKPQEKLLASLDDERDENLKESEMTRLVPAIVTIFESRKI